MSGAQTLGELMGKGNSGKKRTEISLSNLEQFLGDGMPELKFNPLGRVRLVRALKQRFGAGFRSVPGVSGVLKEFDKESAFDLKIAEMKNIKAEKKEEG